MPRIGAVSYLNARPLVRYLTPGDDEEIVHDTPAIIADELAAGRLDAALLPVAEVFAHPEYKMVPDIGIASRGEVRSVKLYCNRPIAEVKTVLLDSASRTSAALLRILMRRAFQRQVEYARYVFSPVHFGRENFDAALVIGDGNFKVSEASFEETYDLGALWTELTGLPMVYAVWATRPALDTTAFRARCVQALKAGLANIDAIVAEETQSHDLTPDFCRAYLTRHIRYWLGPDEYRGMQAFKTLVDNIDAPVVRVAEPETAAP
ncbi:MAG: menaquinone biosynthesis protein [Planctomycetes bacterium]|nr:menaquinone biosynthesis protein [Planctomycetota bacterium]